MTQGNLSIARGMLGEKVMVTKGAQRDDCQTWILSSEQTNINRPASKNTTVVHHIFFWSWTENNFKADVTTWRRSHTPLVTYPVKEAKKSGTKKF